MGNNGRLTAPIDDVTKEHVAQAARKLGLELVVLFGSRVKGRAVPRSDVDIAVSRPLQPRPGPREAGHDELDFRVIGELEAAFAGTLGELDVTVLNGANPLIQYEVAKTGIPLFERAPGSFAKFQSYAARRFDDNRRHFEAQSRYLRRKYGHGAGRSSDRH